MNPFLSTAFLAFAFILGYRLGEKKAERECMSAYSKIIVLRVLEEREAHAVYINQLRADRDDAIGQVEILRKTKGIPSSTEIADAIDLEDL